MCSGVMLSGTGGIKSDRKMLQMRKADAQVHGGLRTMRS
jgi:hypothetical protein